jgi:hypothetical protein
MILGSWLHAGGFFARAAEENVIWIPQQMFVILKKIEGNFPR